MSLIPGPASRGGGLLGGRVGGEGRSGRRGPLSWKVHQCTRGSGARGRPGAGHRAGRALGPQQGPGFIPRTAPWLGHPKSPPPLLRQAWCVLAPSGRAAQVGGNACPCVALNHQLPGGSVPTAPACAWGRRGRRGRRGALALGTCAWGAAYGRFRGARVGFGPEETDAGAAKAGLGCCTPHLPARGPGLHLGCPVPTPWLLEVRELAGLPLQKPALRLTLQREQGSAEQRALGTLLEARGVRGQGPRSWFRTSSGCRALSGEVLLMGTLG